MLTASLQSTWETTQRSKQKPRQVNGSYQNYSLMEDINENKFGSNDRALNGKALFANSQSIPNNRTQDNSNHVSELPNLRIPQQMTNGRGGFNSSNNNGVPLTVQSTSPRGGTGQNRDAVYRKYRGTSRQSNQNGHRSGNRRSQNRYGDGSYGAMSADGPAYGGSANVSTSARPNALPSVDMQLPHIAPQSGALNSTNNKRTQNISSTPSPTLPVGYAMSKGGDHVGLSSSGAVQSNSFTATEEHNISAVFSMRGLKPGNPNWINQDNFFVIENFDNRDTKIFCVLDGHGENGHHVSRRCRESFPHFIRSSALDMDHAFNMMQNDLNASDIDVKCSGATCVMACILNGKLSVYNCGDSRAVLGRRNPNGSISSHALSSDHKPDKPEERKRILSCGGHLGCRQVMVNQGGRGPVSMPVGPCRVWYQHRGETLGLAMSRSLGDSIVHKCGVSAEPEVLEHQLDDFDEFMILATDGVWDVVDNNHAVQMVHNFVVRSANWSPLDAANCICKFARSRWEKLSPMIDDITCIVVKLHSRR